MWVLIAYPAQIPVRAYGGTERILWWLGKELVRRGHKVSYLVNPGSHCSFAEIIEYNPTIDLNDQIPEGIEFVHLFFQPSTKPLKPYLCTMQGNVPDEMKDDPIDVNTVFVSKNHASRHNGNFYIYNGIDPEDYGNPKLTIQRSHLLFLAKASWKVKNLKGAINIAKMAGEKLQVIGGNRFNLKMGFRLTLSSRVKFNGMIGGERKNTIINQSMALLFPVIWNEPFGIAMIESLYFGSPVLGTPYGSLPELITREVGYLSKDASELAERISAIDSYSRKLCHEFVMDQFTSRIMTDKYLMAYENAFKGVLNSSPPSATATKGEKYLEFN